MAICFHEASSGALKPLKAEAPAGAVVGVIGDDEAALESLARLAGGQAQPASGNVVSDRPAQVADSCSLPQPPESGDLVLLHPTRMASAYQRAVLICAVDQARRSGAAVLLISHDQALLRSLSDEVWWLDGGALKLRAAPPDALDAYNKDVAHRLSRLPQPSGLHPSLRRGDGRARLLSVETLTAEGHAAAVWRSGQQAAVRVRVQFQADVADPVIGIMIRTRVGFEVYGTNTELERLSLGPVSAGEELQVTFQFRCDLCPREYTITAASHDPDGVWHDWLEDAVAVAVADSRYTAGVANLRAQVTAEKM
jgi:lipopolysaccharide transport system ATP-binding protein